jgi:phosphocarrier protein FPr
VPILVGLGLDELSVNVPAIPAVKARIRALSYEQAREVAVRALACATAAEVREKAILP